MLRIILLYLFYIIVLGSSLEEDEFSFDMIWSLTCEVSSFVTRSKRSIEFPDIYNAKETFDYLFPLANVNPKEFSARSGRSNSAPGLSMWLDSVKDLWHQECGRRRASKVKTRRVKKSKRKSSRQGRANVNNESKRMNPDDVITWAGYLGNVSSAYNMYFPLPEEVGDEDYVAEKQDSKYTLLEEGEAVVTTSDHEEEDYGVEKYPDEDYDEKYEDSEEEEEEGEEEAEEETTTTTTEKSKKEEETTESTTTTTTTTAAPEPDPYFASYGGDIEYFIPLISFTIPFDGEITLLGFHGFKGMFPY